MCAATGNPESLRRAALGILASLKKTDLVVAAERMEICPHGYLRMFGNEMPLECRKSDNPINRAWSRNVPVIYNMLKWFNTYTAHKIHLDKGKAFVYSGPLRLFNDKRFECLRDAEAVVELMWEDHRTVESIIAELELVEF
jgi:hypothetical protein